MDQLRALYFLWDGQVFGAVIALDNHYLYAVLALLLPICFLIFPANGRARRDGVPWYDAALFLASFGLCVFLFVISQTIVDQGWEFGAPLWAVVPAIVLWVLLLEGARRAGGWAIAVIVAVVSLYPVYAHLLPGAGVQATLADTAAYQMMSNEGVLGIPMRAFANLVIGFLIFGVALQHTGGGRFFLNLAFSLMGSVRGGPAKVAIFSSGLMGSMSGSVISNVLTTGVMTIPAMRRIGIARATAGGVEACASTGGVLMPPVMGATAFIMATLLEVDYVQIAIAATIPSVLYFFGLFVQIDALAGKQALVGIPRSELPSLRQTLKEGWYFVAVFALLVFMMVYLRRETLAPFYATAVLIAVNQLFPHSRWGWRQLAGFFEAMGKLLAELVAILAGVGLIVGALSVTGIVSSLANDLVYLAGNSTIVLLFMGALTSFILGIGMTVTAAYIFLAIVLAPALINGGLDKMAVHLFILYWGMLSFITPPVALGAFAAATLAGARPMLTGFRAMQLGSIIYFIPFFFVLDPALILRGTWDEVVIHTARALTGIVFLAGALQGYLYLFGNIGRGPAAFVARAALFFGGILMALPGSALIGATTLELSLAAMVLIVPAVGLAFLARLRTSPGGTAGVAATGER
jgi:TRAP transporter 4TM/12TM fusion protein